MTARKNVGVFVDVSQLGLQEDEVVRMNTRL